jgi:tripartite-type tricarboxylate transporter receptor subunit TctC
VRIIRRSWLAGAAAALALAFGLGAAQAQNYPSKPVRLVIPTTAGGASDVMAREIAQQLTEMWGQQVIVDNRPGGGVLIGTDAVAKSQPDGYTLLFTYTDHIFYPNYHETMPYDAIGDFAPITTIGSVPLYVVVNPSVPANSIQELVALLKASPGKYNFGSAGSGSSLHLAAELFRLMTGTDMVHIPYKGTTPAFVDLLGGQIHILFPTVVSAAGHVRSKAVRPLAVTSPERTAQLPDMPTVAESGVPGYSAAIWYCVLAPKGTPKPILDKLATDIPAAVNAPKVKNKLESSGVVVRTSSPEELGALMKSELDKWGKVIKSADIKLQ